MKVLLVCEPGAEAAADALAQALPPEWRTTVCADSRQAGDVDYDVLVCSLQSAPQRAADVLDQARQTRPQALRILALPAGLDEREAQRFAGDERAQQVLHEPISEADVRRCVRRLLTSRSLLAEPELRKLLGRIDRLPSPPTTYLALQRASRDPAVELGEIADLVGRDAALTARVLRMANSVMFSRGQPIAGLTAAVNRLGLHTLGQLVLAGEVYGGGDRKRNAELEKRALLASRLAHQIAPNAGIAATASSAALLADTGLLLPADVVEQLDGSRPDWRGLPRTSLFGACLLAMWGLPMDLVEAVAYRHAPDRVERDRFGLVGCVHVACQLAAGEPLDPGWTATMGIDERLSHWRGLAENQRGTLDEDAA